VSKGLSTEKLEEEVCGAEEEEKLAALEFAQCCYETEVGESTLCASGVSVSCLTSLCLRPCYCAGYEGSSHSIWSGGDGYSSADLSRATAVSFLFHNHPHCSFFTHENEMGLPDEFKCS
jgi:hypothetical protein